MAWNYCFSTIGLIFLMFRFYVLEIRCKDIFKPRNRYLSRFLAYYYFIALALNFQIKFLNLTLFVSYFLELYIVADHDLKFLLRYYRHEELNNGENRNGWVLFERLTLHIPLVLTCTVWIFSDLDVFYLTDGSPRKIQVGKQRITFKKTSTKNLAVEHKLSSLIIQGLKELGEYEIQEKDIQQLKRIIDKSGEQQEIRQNMALAPAWIQKILNPLIKKQDNE